MGQYWRSSQEMLAVLLDLGGLSFWKRRVAARPESRSASSRSLVDPSMAAVLTERERMALDLHDTLEQTLCAAMMHLHACKLAQSVSQTQERLLMIEQTIKQSREELRRSLWDLHSTAIEGKSLTEAIEDSCAILVQSRGVRFDVLAPLEAIYLDAALTQNLALVAREAVANALKHAQAQSIVLKITQEDDCVEIVVEDDGIGIDIEKAQCSSSTNGSLGIAGMHKRAARFGGSVSIERRPDSGTAVKCWLPLKCSTVAVA